MSNRTRPYAYTFRTTENERKIIDEKIKSSGLTMTAFIIKAITNKPIVVFANSGEILNELKKAGKQLKSDCKSKLLWLSNKARTSILRGRIEKYIS